jgi:hypothetical protein
VRRECVKGLAIRETREGAALLSSDRHRAGAQYVFLREAYGPALGFLPVPTGLPVYFAWKKSRQ